MSENSERVENGFVAFKPTLGQRAWRCLGYRYHLGEEPEGTDGLRWLRTDVRLHFSLLDRLRLVLTGRLKVSLTTHADDTLSECKTRTDWIIDHPGYRS
jgi:hypothetical protein